MHSNTPSDAPKAIWNKGKLAEATIAEFLERSPDHTLSAVRQESDKRFKDKSLLDRYIAGLREAGLPE